MNIPEEQKFSDRIQITHFSGFEWIDVTGPSSEQLQEFAQTYGLDVFQVKDSLLPGHLPKFETGPVYIFLIFRAFTGSDSMPDGGINELSNKMAFFFSIPPGSSPSTGHLFLF